MDLCYINPYLFLYSVVISLNIGKCHILRRAVGVGGALQSAVMEENRDVVLRGPEVELYEIGSRLHRPSHGKQRVFGIFKRSAPVRSDENPILLVEPGKRNGWS